MYREENGWGRGRQTSQGQEGKMGLENGCKRGKENSAIKKKRNFAFVHCK